MCEFLSSIFLSFERSERSKDVIFHYSVFERDCRSLCTINSTMGATISLERPVLSFDWIPQVKSDHPIISLVKLTEEKIIDAIVL